ncbi:uncharacterized protein CANTADRAFT_168616 [Suhomyces tanzawaensis NRRL Y-17324]|uniref:Uncharacterized protein n=1 Tax=Suhomyces tanzawaensis NRRL Y-17324 TaxID=984487 RepID=A0A1E4SMB5_9ASCO|nr:uncharacterized protein CANTADRAFT_168616 [Suhomyces tanzawaensis NRRL Y-17324]ODV80653.1 hypothetical protein CANTADRAFT_168616 [Suhomyces tanzawaensis NRRL Y-17324]
MFIKLLSNLVKMIPNSDRNLTGNAENKEEFYIKSFMGMKNVNTEASVVGLASSGLPSDGLAPSGLPSVGAGPCGLPSVGAGPSGLPCGLPSVGAGPSGLPASLELDLRWMAYQLQWLAFHPQWLA